MIIEIKGLPEGQKIKHINVDVTFDDSGEVVVKTVMDPNVKKIEKLDLPPMPKPEPPRNMRRDHKEERPVIDIEKREVKDVPNEMKDMEF